MSSICKTCDTKNRLNLCNGREEEFKYCYRRCGSISNIPETITPFNTIEELIINVPKGEFDWVKTETLEIKPYDNDIDILMGVFIDNTYAPIGFIIR